MKAIRTNVVVELVDREDKTDGGIALPEVSQQPNTEGTITSVGIDVNGLTEGQVVGFPAHLGTRVVYKGTESVVIDSNKLLYVRQ